MSCSRLVVALLVVGVLAGGCAKAPEQRALAVSNVQPAYNAYQPVDRTLTTASVEPVPTPIADQPMPPRVFSAGALAGRTLAVASASEIVLQPGEVILTFDDGPRPGKTEAILTILDDFGIGATFMMLGRAAERHPDLVREVALHGHTIGTHTHDHGNLTQMSNAQAMAEIARGEEAVAAALDGSGHHPSPFFRFPYLAQTGFLRTSLTQSSIIVLDVDIDSKDYYSETPEAVLARTLKRLDTRGSGIVLFHDIHTRTVALLPAFLAEIERRGYSVVRLQSKEPGIFGRDVITAESAAELPSLVDLR